MWYVLNTHARPGAQEFSTCPTSHLHRHDNSQGSGGRTMNFQDGMKLSVSHRRLHTPICRLRTASQPLMPLG